jgi:glutamate synthase domain-containing protein 3
LKLNSDGKFKINGFTDHHIDFSFETHGIVKTATIRADKRDRLGHPLDYKILNLAIKKCVNAGYKHIVIEGALGQRYIGAALSDPDVKIEVHGTPGNNLGAFLDGATIEVFGNAQDLTGNTMNSGKIIVHGNAGDVTGLAARCGIILIKGNSGYRTGIHMKEFAGMKPSIVIGGSVKDYLGEYMAGGTILVFGIGIDERAVSGTNIGAGMHGGIIFIRGRVNDHQLGSGATFKEITENDRKQLETLATEYEAAFGTEVPRDWESYTKIVPHTHRPFHGHYDPTLI